MAAKVDALVLSCTDFMEILFGDPWSRDTTTFISLFRVLTSWKYFRYFRRVFEDRKRDVDLSLIAWWKSSIPIQHCLLAKLLFIKNKNLNIFLTTLWWFSLFLTNQNARTIGGRDFNIVRMQMWNLTTTPSPPSYIVFFTFRLTFWHETYQKAVKN